MDVTTRPALSDRLRRDAYLTRFGWHMQDYPQREHRRIRDDLRREIDAAAADVGMAAALRDLGHPHVLAQRYHAELDRPVPRWVAGGAAAGGVVALVCLVVMTYTFGALDALERMGGGRATISPLGVTTHLSVSHGTVGAEWQVRWGVVLAVLAAAALALPLTARVWRLRRR